MGCDFVGELGVRVSAPLPMMKRRDGWSPRAVDVTCVTIGST